MPSRASDISVIIVIILQLESPWFQNYMKL